MSKTYCNRPNCKDSSDWLLYFSILMILGLMLLSLYFDVMRKQFYVTLGKMEVSAAFPFELLLIPSFLLLAYATGKYSSRLALVCCGFILVFPFILMWELSNPVYFP